MSAAVRESNVFQVQFIGPFRPAHSTCFVGLTCRLRGSDVAAIEDGRRVSGGQLSGRFPVGSARGSLALRLSGCRGGSVGGRGRRGRRGRGGWERRPAGRPIRVLLGAWYARGQLVRDPRRGGFGVWPGSWNVACSSTATEGDGRFTTRALVL